MVVGCDLTASVFSRPKLSSNMVIGAKNRKNGIEKIGRNMV